MFHLNVFKVVTVKLENEGDAVREYSSEAGTDSTNSTRPNMVILPIN